MNCRRTKANLVAFLREELAPDDQQAIAHHLEECPECHDEANGYRVTMTMVRQGLAPVEPRADFRLHLRESVLREAACAPTTGRDSRRLLTLRGGDSRESVLEKVQTRLRKSPYLGVSLLLHAAVFLLVVGLPVMLHLNRSDRGSNPHAIVSQLTAGQKLRIERQQAAQNAATLPIHGNDYAISFSVLSQVSMAEALYIAGDGETGAIWAIPVGGEGGFAEEAVRRDIGPKGRGLFVRVELVDGVAKLPARLAQQYLGEARQVVALDLRAKKGRRRIELWPADRLDQYLEGALPDTQEQAFAREQPTDRHEFIAHADSVKKA